MHASLALALTGLIIWILFGPALTKAKEAYDKGETIEGVVTFFTNVTALAIIATVGGLIWWIWSAVQ
jgi:hypothetical protein